MGLGVPGLDELCLGGVGGLLPAKILGPVAEVGEIDIGGEVLPAGVLPDIGAGEALMHEVAAQGACGAAVVEGGEFIPVVDDERAAFLPMGGPALEPIPDAAMELNALTIAGRGFLL